MPEHPNCELVRRGFGTFDRGDRNWLVVQAVPADQDAFDAIWS